MSVTTAKNLTAANILHIVVDDPAWRRVPRLQPALQRAIAMAQAALPKKSGFPCHATLLLTNDAAIKRLNYDFRGLNQPTNVLSFPQYEPQALPRRSKAPVELGDIVIAYRYTKSEAATENKKFINHLSHLAIHGFLHLFGYDHMDDDQAQLMERLEAAIMAQLGLPDPYTPQAAATTGKTHRCKTKRPATTRRKS